MAEGKQQKEFDPTGSLEVPEGAKLEYRDTMVTFKAKKDTVLFLKSPAYQPEAYEALPVEAIQAESQKTDDPTDFVVVEWLNKTTAAREKCYVAKVIKKGEEVTACRYISDEESQVINPYYLMASTFEKKSSEKHGMEERGREIETTASGFIVAEDFELVDEVKPYKGNLFDHPPNIRDIHQRTLGDCFLLAVINSILLLPDGDKYIMSMMKQVKHKNGSRTIVKFFNPLSGEPMYLYSDDIICNPEEVSNAAYAHFLELKFAAVACKKDGDFVEFASPSLRDAYCKGGSPSMVVRVFTRLQPTELSTNRRSIQQGIQTNFFGAMNKNYMLNLYMQMKKNYEEELTRFLDDEMFSPSDEFMFAISDYLERNAISISAEY